MDSTVKERRRSKILGRSGITLIVMVPIGLLTIGQLLAIIGGQFRVGEELCGAVVSMRYYEDIISIWNRNATDTTAKEEIRYVGLTPIHPSYIWIKEIIR